MPHPFRRAAALASIVCAAGLAAAAPADASHLRGGTLSAEFTPDGTMNVYASWQERSLSCSGGGPGDTALNVNIEAPSTTSRSVNVTMPLVRCNGQLAEWRGSETVDAATLLGEPLTNGVYKLSASDCCRVGGIMNASSSGSVSLQAEVRRSTGAATGSPRYVGTTATGSSKGYDYFGDVSAEDPDGAAVAYALTQRTDNTRPDFDAEGPDTVIGSVSGSDVFAPASLTGTWTVGQYWAMKVRARDADGDLSTLDQLVDVTDNVPPQLNAPTTYTVTAGSSATFALNGTDADTGQTLTINRTSGPAWATLSTTPGNPATGAVTLAPPAGTTGRFAVSQYVVDDHPTVSLLDSKTTIVTVVPAKPVFSATPERVSADASPTFTFAAAEGSTFECRVDEGEWAACTSPFTPTGLRAGPHSLAVRAIDPSTGVAGEVETFEWEIAAPAAAAPHAAAPAAAPAACVSGRKMRLNWKIGKRHGRVRGVVVTRNSRRVAKLGGTARKATVDLRGLPAGTFRVRIVATTVKGTKLVGTRTYRTCRGTGIKSTQPRLTLKPQR